MVNFNILFAVLEDGLWLRHADCAHFGMGEDDGGDVFICKVGFGEMGKTEEAI